MVQHAACSLGIHHCMTLCLSNAHKRLTNTTQIAVVTQRGTGQSIFGVLCQVVGTLAGCLLSLVAWYIVKFVHQTDNMLLRLTMFNSRELPGVMVFYFLGMVLGAYPSQNKPALTPFTMSTRVTLTLLVGYELESERIGEAAVTAMGQPYYPPYLLSWRNLLAVSPYSMADTFSCTDTMQILAGVGIGFFWTIFPYPVLESHELTTQIGDTLFTLANLHMKTHMAVYFNVSGTQTNDVPDYNCKETRSAMETRLIRQLNNVRALLANTKYEVRIGGHFPRETYAAIIDKIDSIFRSISLISYSTKIFHAAATQDSASAWLQELQKYATPNEEGETRFVSVLTACGMSIARNQPLPLFLDVPETSSFLLAIKKSPMDLLHPKHAQQPGYSALAAIHASALLAVGDLRELLRLTAELVGRVDFGVPVEMGGQEEKVC